MKNFKTSFFKTILVCFILFIIGYFSVFSQDDQKCKSLVYYRDVTLPQIFDSAMEKYEREISKFQPLIDDLQNIKNELESQKWTISDWYLEFGKWASGINTACEFFNGTIGALGGTGWAGFGVNTSADLVPRLHKALWEGDKNAVDEKYLAGLTFKIIFKAAGEQTEGDMGVFLRVVNGLYSFTNTLKKFTKNFERTVNLESQQASYKKEFLSQIENIEKKIVKLKKPIRDSREMIYTVNAIRESIDKYYKENCGKGKKEDNEENKEKNNEKKDVPDLEEFDNVENILADSSSSRQQGSSLNDSNTTSGNTANSGAGQANTASQSRKSTNNFGKQGRDESSIYQSSLNRSSSQSSRVWANRQRENWQRLSQIHTLRQRLDVLKTELNKLRKEKEDALKELREGLFCSRCLRTKTEIERAEKIPFTQHLRNVNGTVVRATQAQLAAKEKEYDKKIAAKEKEIEKIEDEINRASQN